MRTKDLKVNILDSSLVAKDVTVMRNRKTRCAQYRTSLRNLTSAVFLEAAKKLPLKRVKIKSPVGPASGSVLATDIAVTLILRAAIWMMEPVIQFLPDALVGFIGTRRDEETAQPIPYMCKLPKMRRKTTVFLMDVMLATGGSACDAIQRLKDAGAVPKNIKLLCIFAAPEGIRRVNQEHPEVEIVAAQVDKKLNKHWYIVPGCGDAGDRACGTLQKVRKFVQKQAA